MKKKKQSNNRTNFIIRGKNASADIINFAKEEIVIDRLTERRINTKQSDVTSRILNHWEKLDLIDNDREDGKGWRKFSIVQIVWMEIIQILRKFGFSNDKILLVKNDLIHNQDIRLKNSLKVSDSHLLRYYVASVMCKKDRVCALVFDNGEIEFANQTDLSVISISNTIGNHIRIDINAILQKMFPKRDFSPSDNSSLYALSKEESELLYNLRLGDFDSVSVKLKNKKIETFECEKTEEASTRIAELLQSGKYQDITLKQRDGKLVSITRTELQKVKK